MVGVRRDQEWLDNYLAKSGSRSARTGADLALVHPSPAGAEKAGTSSRAEAFAARAAAERLRIGAFEDEDSLQIAVADFLDRALPEDARWFHVPNGGKRGKREAGRFKAMGVKAGAPDVLVLWADRYVWIELKDADGKLSAAQGEWRTFCKAHGAPWMLCRSVLEVEDFLRACGLKLRATLR